MQSGHSRDQIHRSIFWLAFSGIVLLKLAQASIDSAHIGSKENRFSSTSDAIAKNDSVTNWQKYQQKTEYHYAAAHQLRPQKQRAQSHQKSTTKMNNNNNNNYHHHHQNQPTTTTALTAATTTTASIVQTRSHAASHLSELSLSPSLRNKCALAERELDRCSAQLIGLGQTNDAYPDSMQELDSVYCPRFRETVSCVRNNTDCYKPFERQIINWILSSTRRMNYKRCKNENEKIRFLKLTNSCFATMKNPMDSCMARYIASLDGIAEYNRDLERLSEDDFQIQLSCCANRRFKQCIMKSAKQSCQSHDTLKKLRRTNSVSSQRVARKQLLRVVQDTMEDLKSTLDEMSLTGPDFICTGVDEHFCRTKFDGRYTNRISIHKSIVPAMIKIYANK